jgi:MoxR-like ATPase
MSASPDALARFAEKFQELKKTISSVIVGQDTVVEDLLIVVLAGGHALIEGAPGLGKTRLVRSFAEATQLSFGRVQFTPDLMPADVTGTTVLSRDDSQTQFAFQAGPVFTNVLLADEINRATPKTQSALLEAMQERSVTVSGERHALPTPFITLATQNPLEMEGTYPLPEAQLDRFLFKIMIYRPDQETLKRILRTTTGENESSITPIFSREELLEYQQLLRAVPIAERALDYVVALTEASHQHPLLRLGASPRGAQAMVLAAKGYALAAGRPNVELEDIRRAMLPALRHRVLLGFEAEVEGRNVDDIVQEIREQVDKQPA